LRQRPSLTKRNRERSKAERKKLKAEERERRKLERDAKPDAGSAEDDPDIAGIVCGPQQLDPDLFGETSLTDD
jgi:hypothetical protein